MQMVRNTLGSKDPHPALKSAHIITRSGSVQDLPNMLNGHANHGIVVWHGGALVFGSSAKPGGRKCERFGLTETRWELLPELNRARCGFTPAVWRNAVSLCGGGPPSIEVFNGHSMSLLSLKLRDIGEMKACTSNNCLYIFTFTLFSNPPVLRL